MTLNKNIFATGALISFLGLAACTTKEETLIKEKQAPESISQSFTKSSADVCSSASCVKIQKSSLGKIFLLMVSGKMGGSAPQWLDLKPQVVSFEKNGSRIALLAENYQSIYEEIRTVHLVQSFEVLAEDSESITFDWGKGLQSLVQQRTYDIDNASGDSAIGESALPSLTFSDSFVRSVKFDEKSISLEQISKLQSQTASLSTAKNLDVSMREETLALDVQIQAYNLSSQFKKKEYDASRRVGFFVTKSTRKELSKSVVNTITKWDISEEKGPIRVRISAAVPADYLEAVKEGALYWNHVFGREVLKVVTDVDPQAGPEDRSIMIRWLPWMDSGAAYAMGQSDPLTGEVLRAQVFMPSVFTKVGSGEIVELNGGSPVVSADAIACDVTHSVNKLNDLAREASNSQRLRIAQDGVRMTVAHEMGHALGLRHNFAGSLSSKVSADEISHSAGEYLKNPNHQGLETTTSVMDYVSGVDEVLVSAKIKHSSLAYDKMAMDWAYTDGISGLDESISKYCTDDDIAAANAKGVQIYGCERFDAGNNPMLRKYAEAVREKNNFVPVLFASILGRLLPADKPEQRLNIDAVIADTYKWGKVSLEGLKFVSDVIFEKTKDKNQSSAFVSIEAAKKGDYSRANSALSKVREESLKDAGGYPALLSGLVKNEQGELSLLWLNQQIEDLKNSAYLKSGKTLGGREYTLSEKEQAAILTFFSSFARTNQKEMINGMLSLLPKVDEAERDASGRMSVSSAILGVNNINADDAEELLDLYLTLSNASEGQDAGRVGENLGRGVQLPRGILTVGQRTNLAALFSTKGLNFGMLTYKARALAQQTEKINLVLAEVQTGLKLESLSKEQWPTLAKQLSDKGLVDAATFSWLSIELEALWALEGVL